MKGRVLGYDRVADTIVVRGEDDRRYRLAPADWREQRSPRKGDEVDFDAEGDDARAVFLTGTGAPLRPAAREAPAAALARLPAVRMMMERPILPMAALVLVGCLIGAYRVEGATLALVSVPELVRGFARALADLANASGAGPAPRLGAAVIRIAMVLLVGLYAVPALAALAFWREFKGSVNRRTARLAGLAAMVLPVVLPLVIVLPVQLWVAPGIEERSARLGGNGLTAPLDSFDVLQIFGSGTVVLFLAGAGLWAAASGRLRLAPAPEPDARPSAAPPEREHRDYAPLRAAPPPQPVPRPGASPAASNGTASAPGAAAPAPNGVQARTQPAQAESAAGDDGAMAYLASELRAAIDGSRLAPDPGADAPPQAPVESRPASRADLPPLSGSVWPASARRGQNGGDRNSS